MSLEDIKKGDVLLRQDGQECTVEERINDLIFLVINNTYCKTALPAHTWQELQHKNYKIKKDNHESRIAEIIAEYGPKSLKITPLYEMPIIAEMTEMQVAHRFSELESKINSLINIVNKLFEKDK